MKRALFIITNIFFAGILFGQNSQTMVLSSDPLLTYLQDLAVQTGKSLPFSSGPYTKAELQIYLQRINPAQLTPAGLKTYAAVQHGLTDKSLIKPSADFTFNATLDINLEGLVGWGNESRTWIKGFKDRKPLLKPQIETWLFENFYMLADFPIQKDPFVVIDQDDENTNLFWDMSQLDFQFPYHAGAIIGGDHWNLQLMRAPLSWGWGHTGNLALSDAGVTHDYVGFSAFWNWFKFTTLIVGQDNYQHKSPQVFGYFQTNETLGDAGVEKSKFLLAHRFEFHPMDNFNVALTEMTIYQSRVFDFRYYNPFLVYHNWFLSENSNTDMMLDADWTPLPFINLYGQFYMDYIKTFLKDEQSNDPTPGSYGRLLGITSRLPLGDQTLRLGLEWAQTDPFMYLNNHVNMTVTRRYITNYKGGYRLLVDSPFGYTSGPDAIVYNGWAALESIGFWKIGSELIYITKGSNTLRSQNPADAAHVANTLLTTPSGVVKNTFLCQITGELNGQSWGATQALSMGAEVDLLWSPDFDIQTAVSISYHF